MRSKLRPETESVFEDLKELQKEVVSGNKDENKEEITYGSRVENTVGSGNVMRMAREAKKAKEAKKPGRKKKSAETKLSKRLVMLVSEADAKILAKKRGAGEIYEMDESLFLREWCKRKGLFDDKDIKKTPYENLPKD